MFVNCKTFSFYLNRLLDARVAFNFSNEFRFLLIMARLQTLAGDCKIFQPRNATLQPISVSVSVSFCSDDGFQPMQKELYNNNDKKTE